MAAAKQRVHVEVDSEWLSKILGASIQRALDGYNQSLARLVEEEVESTMRASLMAELRKAAKAVLKDELGKACSR